ncbi:MAG: RDD family protein [Nanoarchaeota archaeon]
MKADKIMKTNPASLWMRISAYLIDILLLAVVLYPIRSLNIDYYSSFLHAASKSPLLAWNLFAISMITALIILFYFSLLEHKTGQTLGKLLMKIMVVSKNKRMTFGDALLRNVSKIHLIFLLADCLNILINRSNQRYLEKYSNTEVISLWAKSKL